MSISDLRGAGRLATDATLGISTLVEALHRQIARPWAARDEPRTGGLTGAVYASVRGVARLAGGGFDALLGRLPGSARALSPGRETLVAALNGVFGDHLAASANPLAIAMQWRRDGRELRLQPASIAASVRPLGPKLLVLVHGLCMSDLQWRREGHDHGAALAADLGYTPVYLNYNSGRAIEVNGFELAHLLQRLVEHWPVPVSQITVLAHSMGGLVARSACVHAEAARLEWRQRLSSIVFLGTPHGGAPLERGGHGLERALGLSRYSAPFLRLARARSAGITDLRHGDATPLPAGVACHAVAGELAGQALLGDGLVPVASAFGRGDARRAALAFDPARVHLARGVGHMALLGDAGVYRRLASWLA